MIRYVAHMMKLLIEEKEFFLYSYQKIQNVFDIMLHKQIWFRHLFFDFVQAHDFLQKTIEEQKNILQEQYSILKDKNKFNFIYIYKVFVVQDNEKEQIYSRLYELIEWLKTKNIRINILLATEESLEMDSLFKSFPDYEDIEDFLACYLKELDSFEMQEIDFMEIERSTKEKKGYFFDLKKSYLTYIFMGINILVFLYITMQGGTTNIYNLIRFGAKYNPLIAAGEYYRLITSIFIHIGFLHLLLNTYALKILGRDIEYLFGSSKFLFIYIISGLCGSLGSFVFSEAVSAGASGAIFGLMGAYLYFGIREPAIFSSRYGLNIISILIINIVFGLLNPGIDNFAHLGGLLGGYFVSSSLGLKDESVFKIKRLLFQLCTIILIAILFLWGMSINQNSWQYHLHSGIQHLEKSDLHNAELAFEKGLNENSRISDFYFYLGYIQYKRGNHEKAVDFFKKTLQLDPNDAKAKNFLNQFQSNE